MTARFIVGDVLETLRKMPDDSVDLVFTSPPFLLLRSYLDSSHPDKSREIGMEDSPGEYIDALLDVIEEVDRVVAPHGSICFEVSDSYSGSGGSGGDYAEEGMRGGQPLFGGTASARRRKRSDTPLWTHSNVMWLAAIIDGEGSIATAIDDRKPNRHYSPVVTVAMNHRSVVERVQAITGMGNITLKSGGRVHSWTVSSQQARTVLQNIWPFLLIKKEQAKAAIELARHIEDYGASRAKTVTPESLEYRESIRRFIMNLNQKGGNEGKYPSEWHPPTPPQPPRHPLTEADPWPMQKSLCLIPEVLRISLAYGFNPLTGRETNRWRIRNVVRWCKPNPSVGFLADKVRPATSDILIACKSRDRFFDLDAIRHAPLHGLDPDKPMGNGLYRDHPNEGSSATRPDRVSNAAGAPPLDHWWIDDVFDQDAWLLSTASYSGAHYAVFPESLVVDPIKAMCPEKVCTKCGEPSRRMVDLESGRGGDHPANNGGSTTAMGRQPLDTRHATTTGWTDCGHNLWRSGIVLDCFGGSGTTGLVATGHGRNAVLIDLDERNASIAVDRIGGFLCEVSTSADPLPEWLASPQTRGDVPSSV